MQVAFLIHWWQLEVSSSVSDNIPSILRTKSFNIDPAHQSQISKRQCTCLMWWKAKHLVLTDSTTPKQNFFWAGQLAHGYSLEKLFHLNYLLRSPDKMELVHKNRSMNFNSPCFSPTHFFPSWQQLKIQRLSTQLKDRNSMFKYT